MFEIVEGDIHISASNAKPRVPQAAKIGLHDLTALLVVVLRWVLKLGKTMADPLIELLPLALVVDSGGDREGSAASLACVTADAPPMVFVPLAVREAVPAIIELTLSGMLEPPMMTPLPFGATATVSPANVAWLPSATVKVDEPSPKTAKLPC